MPALGVNERLAYCDAVNGVTHRLVNDNVVDWAGFPAWFVVVELVKDQAALESGAPQRRRVQASAIVIQRDGQESSWLDRVMARKEPACQRP